MRSPQYSAASIQQYLQKEKIATLDELKSVTGTCVSMTIFRKLKELHYLSSCSHRGKYYSLESIAEFDTTGLWRVKSILFSKHGTLLDTVEDFVCHSEAGYTSIELREILSLEVKEQLLQLWVETRLSREIMDNLYVYTSADPRKRDQQILFRKQKETGDITSSLFSKEIKAALILFWSLLDEKQKRLYAGLESIKHGRGGDAIIARLLNIDVHTVSKGRTQLLEGDLEMDRIRRKGGGRTALKKNA